MRCEELKVCVQRTEGTREDEDIKVEGLISRGRGEGYYGGSSADNYDEPPLDGRRMRIKWYSFFSLQFGALGSDHDQGVSKFIASFKIGNGGIVTCYWARCDWALSYVCWVDFFFFFNMKNLSLLYRYLIRRRSISLKQNKDESVLTRTGNNQQKFYKPSDMYLLINYSSC